MEFKGLKLEAGDFVAFTTSAIPLPEVEAVVIDVKDNVLEVMSTLIAPFCHSGKFTENDVGKITVVHPAEVAIPLGSGSKNFRKGARASVIAKDENGTLVQFMVDVIAALDGLVVGQRQDGQLITGGASHFTVD